ncbi:hypothetical protein GCM10008959_34070 [Deinococcus seoulensis]|uniref:RNA polymerase sigma-70 region 2 domain-containing protein n=1 Tax=Deinococcus seoulensis TaxID=1837379 RepID=A0ABQ2RXQ6_9DEIO|nr:hypothetical protein [Deinococcus seoulensis]GGR69229.1 hypothetical protein GCM10008959_34070 [Deinococcus seoulensis]
MSSPQSPLTCEDALRGLIGGQGDLRACLSALLPTLYALAQRHALPNVEDAVGYAMQDIRDHCHCWPRTGLPARTWVLGLAQRRFQQARLAA